MYSYMFLIGLHVMHIRESIAHFIELFNFRYRYRSFIRYHQGLIFHFFNIMVLVNAGYWPHP